MLQVGRYHGVELDLNEFRRPSGEVPTAAALSLWAQTAGMWSQAVRIRWRHLLRLNETGPVVLLFNDGSAGLMTGVNAEQNIVFLKDPFAPADVAGAAVDELRLSEVWSGEAILLRANRGQVAEDASSGTRDPGQTRKNIAGRRECLINVRDTYGLTNADGVKGANRSPDEAVMVSSELGQITPVLFQCLIFAFRILIGHPLRAAHLLKSLHELVARDAEFLE